MSASPLNILYMPEVALEKIFSFLSFDEIARNRIVCKQFNEVGSKLLSRGFIQLEKRHATIYKKVKSLLPRRESERKAHPLSRHCDILQAIETRISMLNMTYVKYIESNLLCFIPGKVLDEMKNVMDQVEGHDTPPRTHQLLQELRDLSSMAMEHFDEQILPGIKEQIDRKSTVNISTTFSCLKSSKFVYGPNSLSNEIYKVKKQSRSHKHCISYLSQSTQKLCQKVRKQNIRLKSQTTKIKEQERKLKEQAAKIQEQEAALADIKKHIDEWDQKYTDLTNELVRARDDILAAAGVATQRPTGGQTNSSPAPPKIYKSNIKPRTTHILPKNYINLHFDLDRKRKSNLLPEIPLKRNKSPEKEDNRKENQINLSVQQIVNLNDLRAERAVQENNDSPENIGPQISRKDIDSLCSFRLFTHPLYRKRKMQEDIDLK